MDENLRVALIDFLNLWGAAPDPKSGVGITVDLIHFDFKSPHGEDDWISVSSQTLQDLLQFLLLRQVA